MLPAASAAFAGVRGRRADVHETSFCQGNEVTSMLHTIEIEIDATGRIHPLEPLEFIPSGRALLTLLEKPVMSKAMPLAGRAGDALALLAGPRFANRPAADPTEVAHRIAQLRDGWGERP